VLAHGGISYVHGGISYVHGGISYGIERAHPDHRHTPDQAEGLRRRDSHPKAGVRAGPDATGDNINWRSTGITLDGTDLFEDPRDKAGEDLRVAASIKVLCLRQHVALIINHGNG
jgi:hypothetical protein